MAHGVPDYGAYQGRATVHPVTDLGELAVRLGSPVAYDRLGDVIYFEDFEDGLNGWVVTTSGDFATGDVSYGRGIHGAWACHLVAGSTMGQFAQIARSFAYPVLSNLGLEFAWTVDANLLDGIAYLDIYTGVSRLRWGVRYHAPTNQNGILDASGAWVAVGDPTPNPAGAYLFIPTKLVGDPNNLAYRRFLAGPISFPCGSTGPQVVADASLPHLSVTLRITATPGNFATTYLDRVILTQNEY